MFKRSLKEGIVNEQQVRLVLKEILLEKPAHLIKILRIYKNLTQNAINQQQVIVETASPIEEKSKLEKTILAKTSASKVLFKVNSGIISGSRITHGDWIWDATLDGKLKRLTIND